MSDTYPLAPDPVGPERIGPYRVERALGAGGMGAVWLARHPDGRAVAVKVVHEHLRRDPQFRRRFAREAAAARRVAGFCTARLLDADVTGDPPYLVTEYVDGPSLHDYVTRTGPLPGSDAEALAVGVAAALTAIHAAGVVHRDLTPRNVVLSPFGPRVIDFGIAAALDAATLTGPAAFGTPGWLAPEQLAGAPAGPPADVFCWGLLVAWAGTGRHPYGVGPAGTVPAPTGPPRLGEVPPRLAALVARALAGDPRARPTARDLLLALAGATEGAPVQAALAPLTRHPAPRPAPPAAARPAPRTAPRPSVARPAVTAAAAPPAPRRRRWGRMVVFGLVILGVLCCVGTLRGGGEQSPAGVAGPASRAPSRSPTPKPTAVADGQFQFAVTGLTCGARHLGEGALRREAQGQYCRLGVQVTNVGARTARIWLGSQRLLDGQGREYADDAWAWVYHEPARAVAVDVNPGNTVAGEFVFDTPAGVTFTAALFRDSPFSRGTRLPL